ncbi:Vitamin B12 transporter BtuB precursor [compost metagenome]
MKSVSKLFFCLTLLFLSSSALAQTSSISGTIKYAGNTVVGASVFIKSLNRGVVTDNSGNFVIEKLAQGTYHLQVSFVGMIVQTKNVTVGANEKLVINFVLKEDSRQLKDVKVTGKTHVREMKESGFNVNAIDAKQYANTTADLNQVLNRTTGIRIREEGGMGSNFNFSLNGLSGKSVKFFIDGIPTDVMGSAMSLNNIPINLAEQIEVYKGVVPVGLGADALGGAVNVTTNQNIVNYLDASYSIGSWNTNRAALTGQYKNQKTGFVVKASGFYNYSDNNYLMKDVEIWNPSSQEYQLSNQRRFNDEYSARMGQLEVGLVGKKWADALFVGATYSDTDQEVQTGIRQDEVYGGVKRKGDALNTSIRYRKDNLFTKGLNLSVFGSHAVDNLLITDTLNRLYSWDGTYVNANRAERGGQRAITNISRPRTYARGNLTYEINPSHSVNLNYTLDYLKNKSYNELLEDEDEIPSTLDKHILGLSYQQNLLNNRLSNTFFGKYYGIGTAQSKALSFDSNGKMTYEDRTEYLDYYGYGVASRYKILADLGVKVSYEHAYRLQESEEMFGNGITSVPNLDLKPEQSNNINLGVYYGKTINNHRLFVEGSYFIRDVSDYIFFVASSRTYENKSNVEVNGIEGEVRYNYKDFLSLGVNASYQNSINTTKYTSPGSTVPEITYLDPIPNLPSFYGNADITFRKNDFLSKDATIQFNWYTQYVQWFYLYWKSQGNIQGNSIIPTQYIHNASITYSREKGRYNVSLECRNLTDNLAYDNFRLQKPGRSFAVKFRYFIK